MENGRLRPKHVSDETAYQLTRLEADVAEAIQLARQEGYQDGHQAGWCSYRKNVCHG